MSEQVINEQALLTSATILQLSGEASEQRRATRLLADLRAGEPVADLLNETKPSGPGRFGAGLEDSAILLAVYSALQAFWKVYLEKLVAKGAEKASNLTAALLDKLFKQDLEGSERDKTISEIKKCLEVEAHKRKISQAKLRKLLEAVDKLEKK
jgi:hypothetical protein